MRVIKNKNINWNDIALFITYIGVLLLTPLVIINIVMLIIYAQETDSTNWVAIIEAFGTVFLGIIAIYQNRNAQKINKRLTEIESNRDEMALRPSVLLTNWRGKYLSENEINNPKHLYVDIGSGTLQDDIFYSALFLEFSNTTTSFLILEYSAATVFSNLASTEKTKICNWGNCTSNQQNPRLVIPPGEAREIGFYAQQSFFDSIISNMTKIKLELDNQIGLKYLETIDFILVQFKKMNPTDNFIYTTILPGKHDVVRLSKKVIE